MELSKETLNTALEALELKRSALRRELDDVWEIVKQINNGDFRIESIQRKGWSNDNKEFIQVTFKSTTCDFTFDACDDPEEIFSRLSWSSTSWYGIKDNKERQQILRESKERLMASVAMVNFYEALLNGEESAKWMMIEAQGYFWNQIQPLEEKYYEIDKQINQVKSEIRKIDRASIREKALKELVGNTYYLVENFQYSTNICFSTIELEFNEKRGQAYLIDSNDRKKYLTDDQLVELYYDVFRPRVRKESSEIETAKYGEPEYWNYFKYPNHHKTYADRCEARNSQEQITYEEYEAIRAVEF